MKKTIWVVMAAVLLSILIGCGQSDSERKRANELRQKANIQAYQLAFKVGVMPTLDCLPIYILHDSLLYDTTHADIRLVHYAAQMDCDTAMENGRVDACVTDLVRAQHLKRKGVMLRWFASTNAYWNLYGGKQENLKSIEGLADKSIALARYSITDYLTTSVLRRAKLKRPALRVQINDVFVRMNMAEGNELDAFWFTEPMATKMKLDGNKMLFSSQDLALRPGVIALVSIPRKDAKRYEAQLAEFRKSYNRAVELINQRGLVYYSDLIVKYMGVDNKTVMNLPKITFEPAQEPRMSDLKRLQQQ